MIDPVYALRWPLPLFRWEAQLILQDFGSENWTNKVAHLLRETYQDPAVAEFFDSRFNVSAKAWTAMGTAEEDARTWFTALIEDESRLQPYKQPIFWAERNAKELSPLDADLGLSFPRAFLDLIEQMRQTGYFPRTLPFDCVDDYSDGPDTATEIRRATKLEIPWPLTNEQADALPEPALYSLIEFFHHQAQRPRTTWYHSFNDCGLHYDNFNARSGQIVYRWRVNALLAGYKVPLHLGSSGEEVGHLVRRFRSPLNALAAEQVTQRANNPRDEVAHAVRMYRSRDATIVDKRAAVALLAGEMEPKRRIIQRKISAGDESDLFRIANQFTIRHRDKAQKADFGDEFLDWVFWTYLATIRLLDDIASRPAAADAPPVNASRK